MITTMSSSAARHQSLLPMTSYVFTPSFRPPPYILLTLTYHGLQSWENGDTSPLWPFSPPLGCPLTLTSLCCFPPTNFDWMETPSLDCFPPTNFNWMETPSLVPYSNPLLGPSNEHLQLSIIPRANVHMISPV